MRFDLRSLFHVVTVATTVGFCSVQPTAQAAPPLAPAPANAPAAPRPVVPRRSDQSAMTPLKKDPARHTQFMYRKTEGEIGVLFLGDSITDFWPRVGEWSWLRLAPYKPANFGIGGDRTENVLWRITNGELDGISPKVVVILIGSNNVGFYREETAEWAANGIKKVVETVHEKLPQTKVLLLGVFPRGTYAGHPWRLKIQAINKIISGCDDGAKTRYLDITDKFVDKKGILPPDLMPDGVHPSAHGYDVWFDAMHPLLDSMMGGN